MKNKLLKEPLLALGRAEQAPGQARAVSWAAVLRALKWELGAAWHKESGWQSYLLASLFQSSLLG